MLHWSSAWKLSVEWRLSCFYKMPAVIVTWSYVTWSYEEHISNISYSVEQTAAFVSDELFLTIFLIALSCQCSQIKCSLLACALTAQISSDDALKDLYIKTNTCNLYWFSSLICCVQQKGTVLGWEKLWELSRGIFSCWQYKSNLS